MAYDNAGAAVGAAGHYAAALTSALIANGEVTKEDALGVFTEFLNMTFVACEALKTSQPASESTPAPRRQFNGGGNRGGNQRGGGNQAPGEITFKGGKHAGRSISEVYYDTELDENGRDGSSYIEWVSGNERNPFMAKMASQFLDSIAA